MSNQKQLMMILPVNSREIKIS